MELLVLLLRWLHVFSSVVLVGGLFYFRFVVLPATEKLSPPQRESLEEAMRRNWAKWLMASVGLLLLTGVTNMVLVPMLNTFTTEDYKKAYNILAGIKFLLALPVFFLVSTLNGRSANAEKFRLNTRRWLNLSLALSVAIILLGGYLRFIPRVPKDAAISPPPAAVEPIAEESERTANQNS